ncbi:MAG: ATP-binding protein [Pseudomonadota bacterium]
MIEAWAVAFAACVLAGVFAVRASLATRRLAAERAATLAKGETGEALQTLLATGAQAGLLFSHDGTTTTFGTLPAALTDALQSADAPDGTLAGDLAKLRTSGRPFERTLTGEEGPLTVEGTLGAGTPRVLVKAAQRSAAAGEAGAASPFEGLLESAPFPAWVESEAGERRWTNRAYAEAVGHSAPLPEGTDEALLDANAMAQLTDGDGPSHGRVQTVIAGERRVLDVAVDRREGVLAALALDVTETVRELTVSQRTLEGHAATFDRLAAAVAMYGPDRRLTFHNAAFQTLWQLPATFLEHAPAEEQLLDRLRAERKLPETADFKAWKRDQLRGYETREGFERWWHLPDGQTLRVIANPGPHGGVTYIYENVTEQLALERRYNALTRVQAETIDNLGEGVASFGPDGLLRLSNPAFWELSGVHPADVGDHVRVIGATVPAEVSTPWAALAERVTGLTDHRTTVSGRIERADGQVLDYAFSPLPDGSTLATLVDVTDSVNVARALLERNNALVEADRLKNAFIEHVSYELRSPLTTIIGFIQLLTRPEFGALTDRQREYADHVNTSSEALLTIIDGILDLATIDAGIMELSLGPVDIEATAHTVLDGLKHRIAEGGIEIEIDVAGDAKGFEGDPQRVRQVLFNLLSNAISHSPEGGTVTVEARSEGDFVALSVRDRGPGITRDKAEAVFERFMTSTAQGRRGGVGLGLSLVKSFVELHGGTVAVAPVEGAGAALKVRFPRKGGGRQDLAA